MKAGTTFLRNALEKSNKVYIPNGEVNFFGGGSVEGVCDYPTGGSWDDERMEKYSANFKGATEGRVIGEDSTTYLHSPKAPPRIREALPGVKLIFLLRDPVSRTYSHYWHRVRKGRAVHPFGQELKLGSSELILRSCYSPQVEKYLKVFPRSQIKFIISERLFEDTNEVMRSVWEFLDLEPNKSCDIDRVDKNKSLFPKSLSVQLALNYIDCKARLWYNGRTPGSEGEGVMSGPKRLCRSLLFRLRRWNLDNDPYPPMKTEIREWLSRRLAEVNHGISDLIGTDVTRYWPSVRKND